MLSDMPIMAFVPTTDLDRAQAFYAGVLGLRLDEVTPFACVVSGPNAVLRVTKVDGLRPQPFTVLGWSVDDIGRAVATLVERGVRFTRFDGLDQDADGVWTAPGGARVAWFADPDGNTLSLTQAA